jgi:hypothetical protein
MAANRCPCDDLERYRSLCVDAALEVGANTNGLGRHSQVKGESKVKPGMSTEICGCKKEDAQSTNEEGRFQGRLVALTARNCLSLALFLIRLSLIRLKELVRLR